MRRYILVLVVLVAVAFGQTSTAQQFDQLKIGQSAAEVHALIGTPQRVDGLIEYWNVASSSSVFQVQFNRNGNVAAFGIWRNVPSDKPRTEAAVEPAFIPAPLPESDEHEHARQEVNQCYVLLASATKRDIDLKERLQPYKDAYVAQGCDRTDMWRMKTSAIKQCAANLQARANLQLNAGDVAVEAHTRECAKLRILLDHTDDCLAVYKKTIDERAADITTRESELITACKALGMYPPK
jgi:hypothetical protein